MGSDPEPRSRKALGPLPIPRCAGWDAGGWSGPGDWGNNMSSKSTRAWGLAVITLLAAEAASAARPADPWILRVTMPKKVRVNIITLAQGLTVAYDAPNAA